MLRLKSLASFFYAGMMRHKGALPQEPERAPMTIAQAPMTMAEQHCCERARSAFHLRQEEAVDVMRYLSAEEGVFLQHLKEAFELSEEDLHLFHLIGYARHANELEMRCSPNRKKVEMPQPDFSSDCLSLLMECVQSSLASSRGYYAAMVYLKSHPVPTAWRAENNS